MPESARILTQTAAALDRMHSFHLQGTGESKGVPISFSGDFSVPGRFAVTVDQGGGTVAVRLVGANSYLRANAQYWTRAGAIARVLPVLAARWVKQPAGTSSWLTAFRAMTERSTLGYCAVESGLGMVTVGAKTKLHGRRVVVLVDHGNVPGSTTSRLYIAAGRASLPLLITQTGRKKAGGLPDPACGDASNSSSTNLDRLSFSRYDRPLHITAPSHAIGLGQLAAALRAASR
jgi:hypothetical protein